MSFKVNFFLFINVTSRLHSIGVTNAVVIDFLTENESFFFIVVRQFSCESTMYSGYCAFYGQGVLYFTVPSVVDMVVLHSDVHRTYGFYVEP